jgi:hypothetical protein
LGENKNSTQLQIGVFFFFFFYWRLSVNDVCACILLLPFQ